MKTRSIAYLAASLMALSISQPGFAQEDTSEAQEAAPEAADAEAADAEAADAEAAAGEDAAETEAASGESSEQGDATAETAEDASDGEQAATAKAGEAESADDAEAGSKTGPGGKPLREDYPGTEESKKARMDTDRIEGLSFEEGEAGDEVYDVRIRELETKVDDLKEKVFRSKSRIVLLKETVLTGNLAGSRAIVSHINDIGGAYVLKRIHYALDGSRIYNKADKDGELDDEDSIELFNGSITPGTHRISILMELKGSGYGVFSYMDGYKFTIQDSCDFSAQEGQSTILKVRLFDRGGAMEAYEKRPGIECVVNSVQLSGDDLKKDAEQGDDAGGEDAKPAKNDESASK